MVMASMVGSNALLGYGNAGKVYGMAGAEKNAATIIYNFAGLNGQPSKPKTTE